MVTEREILWLAGFLEGEGCFGTWVLSAKPKIYRSPRLVVTSTDKDVLDKASILLGGTSRTKRVLPSGKTAYQVAVGGAKAIGWMMTLYQFMGERRKSKIREVITKWVEHPMGKGQLVKVWANAIRKI